MDHCSLVQRGPRICTHPGWSLHPFIIYNKQADTSSCKSVNVFCAFSWFLPIVVLKALHNHLCVFCNNKLKHRSRDGGQDCFLHMDDAFLNAMTSDLTPDAARREMDAPASSKAMETSRCTESSLNTPLACPAVVSMHETPQAIAGSGGLLPPLSTPEPAGMNSYTTPELVQAIDRWVNLELPRVLHANC